MPDDSYQSSVPEEWLARARSNLIRAKQPRPEGAFLEDFCFDAQQAVEKALKAFLLDRGIQFRYVHDIGELLTLLEQGGVRLPETIRAASDLTEYAVEARYPGLIESVTEEEYEQAVTTAEEVVRWVESLMRGGNI